MHDLTRRTDDGLGSAIGRDFWIGAAWACGFSFAFTAALIALVVGAWRLAWAAVGS